MGATAASKGGFVHFLLLFLGPAGAGFLFWDESQKWVKKKRKSWSQQVFGVVEF